MANVWYYRHEGKEQGPFLPSELRRKAHSGEIKTSSLIRRGADGDWVQAAKVKGLFTAPTPAQQRVVATSPLRQQSPAAPVPSPQNVAQCWYCGNPRRTTDHRCGTCGAGWSRPDAAVVAEQYRAAQGTDARSVIGLIFLLLAGVAMMARGFMNFWSPWLGLGGLALVGTSLMAMLMPRLVRGDREDPGKRRPADLKSSSKGQALATTAGSMSDVIVEAELAVPVAEGFQRGVGYFGYVALWVTIAGAIASVAMALIVVAAFIALLVACLSAFQQYSAPPA